MIELFGNIFRVVWDDDTSIPSLLIFDNEDGLQPEWARIQAGATLSLPYIDDGWTEVEDISEMKISEIFELNKELTEENGIKIDMSKLDKRGLSFLFIVYGPDGNERWVKAI